MGGVLRTIPSQRSHRRFLHVLVSLKDSFVFQIPIMTHLKISIDYLVDYCLGIPDRVLRLAQSIDLGL